MEAVARAIGEDGPPAGFWEEIEWDAPAKVDAGEMPGRSAPKSMAVINGHEKPGPVRAFLVHVNHSPVVRAL